jgi:hypothetical protein
VHPNDSDWPFGALEELDAEKVSSKYDQQAL